uniref:Syndecan n=1 Tax=Ditylenchus dipsaci TaxID=166011 RepID=A0A915DQ59_9BILA
MKFAGNSNLSRIDFYCYVVAVLLLPFASALIASDSKAVASNLDGKANNIEGSGSYPEKTSTSRTDPQIRPDAEFNSSGASPDDEDGDVNEGSGEIEGSGSVPSNIVVSTTKSSVLASTTSINTTPATTTAKPRHQFNEERIVNMHGDSESKASTTRLPILLDQRTTTTASTTTSTRQSVLTTTARSPPPTTPTCCEWRSSCRILMTILLVMFIIYRMRKKDEGSYSLDEPHAPPNYSYAYQKASTKEFYA